MVNQLSTGHTRMLTLCVLLILTVQKVLCSNCTQQYTCTSCKTVKICTNTQSWEFSCPSDKPFCNNATGTCSFKPTPECWEADSYPCPQDGVFPDPKDCSKYRVCTNYTSRLIACPKYYAFEASKGTCTSDALCFTIGCHGKSGIKVPYYGDPSFYTYCVYGEPVFVERCPTGLTLDLEKQVCTPACSTSGHNIPDPEDCTKYFVCIVEPLATEMSATKTSCPIGYGFDPVTLRCVPVITLPSCNALSVATDVIGE